MSIFGSMNAGISGIQVQGNKIGIISDNLANVSTIGYKANTANFADLVTGTKGSAYTAGGVTTSTKALISAQGSVSGTGVNTNLAIAGSGFFPVTDAATSSVLLYTRNGSFEKNADGYLVNGSGFFLQGWKLDSTGNLPAGVTTAVVPINVTGLQETPTATTTISLKANLLASQAANAAPYVATDPTKNMTSGVVSPNFNMPITIIDSKGNAHTMQAGFLKTAINTWSVELYVQPATDVTATGGVPTATGQIATGTLTFNGDGTLASVSPALQSVGISWQNGSLNSALAIGWGTAGPIFGTPGATVIGKSDGISQYDSSFEAKGVTQDGIQVGQLKDISIDQDGYVVGNFDNHTTQRFYKIPLAVFRDPNTLESKTANVFAETAQSGSPLYFQANQGAAGKIVSSSLEQSTSETSTELTDMIVAQRAYEANTKVVSSTDNMLQTLTNMLK